MLQALRLTEFFLAHGVESQVIGKIILYLTVSFLPAILPMSLIFAVILTYNRFSNDSEIVAFKSVGLNTFSLTLPAALLSVAVALFSAATCFEIAPWGNRQFELLIGELGDTKVINTIKEGTFSEGFFDLVVYANEIDVKKNELKNVFIYDSREESLPVTIIAQKGMIYKDPKNPKHSNLLRLSQGNIHRTGKETYTKVDFETYDISLSVPVSTSIREKSPPSLTFKEISTLLKGEFKSVDQRLTIVTEFHKRAAIPVACVVFGLLGVGLGTVANRRSQKTGGMVISLGVIVVFWILYVVGENLARSGTVAPAIAIWSPNILFFMASLFFLKRLAKT